VEQVRIFNRRKVENILRGALFFMMIGGGLLVASSRTLAGNPSLKGAITSELIYRQLNEEIPPCYNPYEEREHKTTLKLDLSGLTGKCQYELGATGYFDESLIELDQATLSGFSGSLLWEIGKQDWTFGQGLAFSPNYPLTPKAAGWGFESRIVLSSYSLVVGGAQEHAQVGAVWLRAGKMGMTSDWGIVLSSLRDEGRRSWQGGTEFSWDLLNGLSIHGGANIQFPEEVGKYILGGMYSGESLTSFLEYYCGEKEYLNFGLCREPGLFGRWQWGVKEILSLQDGVLISIFNLQYLGDHTLTPEFVLTNFGGGEKSMGQPNPLKWEFKGGLTVGF
jgi:hypothetical protein